MIEPWLLELLVCPRCKGELVYESEPEALVCPACKLRFEVRDNIPILLIDEASPVA